MKIEKIPQNFASLRSPLIYTFTDSSVDPFDITVTDENAEETVGAKRLTGVTQASIDAAPFLRRRVVFRPEAGPTGFVSALGRTVAASVSANGVRTPIRTFIPAQTTVTPPALLSTFGETRLIGRKAYDELTLCTPVPCVIRIVARNEGSEIESRTYTAPSSGFILFRLNPSDFPGADQLQLHVEGIRMLTYRFTGFRAGHCLAWRSSVGSVEHYTFPVEKEIEEETAEKSLLTENGRIPVSIRSRKLITLLSAYEPRQVLEPLTEICSSPAVWSLEGGIYTPVEVVCDRSGLRRHGTLHNLEVQIRHQPRTLLP